MKIGITINVGQSSIWSNGVNQNAIYLGVLLQKGGHDAYIIHANGGDNKSKKQLESLPLNVKTIPLNESFNESFDVIIQLGLTVETKFLKAWKEKNSNIKLVAYECGNHFFIDNEKVLYNAHGGDKPPKRVVVQPVPDQIWVIPQMENTNLFYYQHLRKCNKATVVPFVWDPIAIETFATEHKLKTYTERPIENVAIMEPNISLMKNCILPIVSLERFVKYEKGELKKIYIVGGDRLKDNYTFKTIIANTELYGKGLLTAEPRIQTHTILNGFADLVLSWQWENPLNYLYFDVCWLGWPLVHNAELCKDLGYYYEGFDVDSSIRALKNAINRHNSDKNYMDNQRRLIKRYTKENKNMIKDYNTLLNDLVNDKFKKRKYVWKTNGII